MSLQGLINLIRDIEVDARKAQQLARHIHTIGANHETTEELYMYAHNTLVGIDQAERMALALKIEAEAERSSNIKSMDAAVAAVARAVSEKGESK